MITVSSVGLGLKIRNTRSHSILGKAEKNRSFYREETYQPMLLGAKYVRVFGGKMEGFQINLSSP